MWGKYTEDVGTTQTVHYHVQDLPQECKPQRGEPEPISAASWETD